MKQAGAELCQAQGKHWLTQLFIIYLCSALPTPSVFAPPFVCVCSPFLLFQVFEVGFWSCKRQQVDYHHTHICPPTQFTYHLSLWFPLLAISGVLSQIMILQMAKLICAMGRLKLATLCTLFLSVGPIQCFQLDYDAVKSKVGYFEKIKTDYYALSVHQPPYYQFPLLAISIILYGFLSKGKVCCPQGIGGRGRPISASLFNLFSKTLLGGLEGFVW